MMGANEDSKMTHTRTELNNVSYNAANQCFEALVTVTQSGKRKAYACAIEAPITLSFEQAAKGLKTQALRRSREATGMYSQMRHAPLRPRAGRARFDPRKWFANLGFGVFKTAA
jgi:hypothetical protein